MAELCKQPWQGNKAQECADKGAQGGSSCLSVFLKLFCHFRFDHMPALFGASGLGARTEKPVLFCSKS